MRSTCWVEEKGQKDIILTSLAAFGSDTQAKVISQVETTSAGVLPSRAPSWMNKSHCKSQKSKSKGGGSRDQTTLVFFAVTGTLTARSIAMEDRPSTLAKGSNATQTPMYEGAILDIPEPIRDSYKRRKLFIENTGRGVFLEENHKIWILQCLEGRRDKSWTLNVKKHLPICQQDTHSTENTLDSSRLAVFPAAQPFPIACCQGLQKSLNPHEKLPHCAA